jgi:transposase
VKPGTKTQYWTEEEHAQLMRLVRQGKKWPEVAAILGRSVSAVQTRHHDFKDGGGFRRTDRANYQIAEAARAEVAMLEHKTLTAAFFGDPLPGRSALDRKSAEGRA